MLVADDEELVRNLATSMLEQMGFRVLAAVDGREAVELFDQHAEQVDIALLDLSMPGLDGEETLLKLRARRADLPIILSSGFGDVRKATAEARDVAFLRKPYRLRELRETIQELVPEIN